MKEVRLYGSFLFVLLVGSFLSFTRQDPNAPGADKPTIVDLKKGDIKSLAFYTKTATISVTFKKSPQDKEYAWFEVEQNKKTRTFVGNEAFQKTLESFTPFKGLRSLGRLSATELKATSLDKPERKLVLGVAGEEKVFDVGGRTSGARDHYLRVHGKDEIFLVGSTVLGDLEFPEGRFMQRRLREEPLTSISKVLIAANGKSNTVLHKNRLSPNDSFWAAETSPDEKSETLENYVDKLDKLSAIEYPATVDAFPKETPFVEVTWYGEDENKPINTTQIWKSGTAPKVEYYALSPTTRIPVKLPKNAGEQIERDLSAISAN